MTGMKRRGVRKRIGLAVLLCFLISLTGCGDPPVGKTETTGISRYGNYDSFAAEKLNTEFAGCLPEKVPDGSMDTDYFYTYQCALFGDPSFAVRLNVTFQSRESYEAELARIQALPCKSVSSLEGRSLYVLNGDQTDAERYLDEEIYDGLFFVFELAAADDKTWTIQYLSGRWWDSAQMNHTADLLRLLEYMQDNGSA
ncbi:MAG: hypothetical protein ACI4GO_02315 [Hominenteromicrobium sp.]